MNFLVSSLNFSWLELLRSSKIIISTFVKVIPFDTTKELRDTIKWYRPNIMVIGSDWKGKEVIGKKHADKLIFFDRVGDYSTTKILEKKWVK